MKTKFLAIVKSFMYLLLFLLSIALSSVIFGLSDKPELAAVGAALIAVGALFLRARFRRLDEWDGGDALQGAEDGEDGDDSGQAAEDGEDGDGSVKSTVDAAGLRRAYIIDKFSALPIARKKIAIIVAVTVPVTLLIQCLRFVVPPEYVPETPPFELTYGVFSLISLLITTPIAEEVFFRGFILKCLKGSFKTSTAIIISVLLFSGMHSGPLWSMMAIAAGIYYSALFTKYRSIYAPIAAHMTSNLIALLYNVIFSQ